MSNPAASSMQNRLARPRYDPIAMLFGIPLVTTLLLNPIALAGDHSLPSEEHVAEQAKAAWESGAINPAIEILDQGAPVTSFMRFEDRVRMWVTLPDGTAVFGAIDQQVVRA